MNREVSGLEAVDERDPDEIAEGEHQAETVVGEVDSGEDGRLVVEGIHDVEGLEDGDDEDRVGDVAVRFVLMSHESQIENDPTEQAGTKFHEGLDVDFSVEQRDRNARVQFTSDEPVIQHVARMTTGSKLTKLLVARLYLEGTDVDVCGEREGDQEVRGHQLEVIAVDECPDLEVWAKRPSPGGADAQDDQSGRECCSQAVRYWHPRNRHSERPFHLQFIRYISLPPDLSSVPSTSLAGRST
ncbi:Delta(14)-sterol [Hortaea werneckii]|nr:Delta(14)-sterol [Hortaea werneckii]